MAGRAACDVALERDVAMTMRDGTALRADIYTPVGAGPYPVLLMRTPYDKSVAEFESLLHPEWYARQGFIVVTQDVRGCFASDGEFEPFVHEFDDGVDTIKQCAALPTSNGKVGMYGFSYPGTTQLFPATRGPEALKAIAPAFTNDGVYEDWCYKNGAFQQCLSQVWAAGLAIAVAFRKGVPADWRPAFKAFAGLPGEYDHLPLTDHPSLPRDFAPFYYEWLDHPTFDDYWQRWHLGDRYGDITIPALHLVGWYDLFIEGTIRNYQGLLASGGSALARNNQKLVVGPWYHQPWAPAMGELDFGDAARARLDELMVRWYDHWLKGEDNGIMDEPRVSLFVMGANRWREADSFPLPETNFTRYHLHSGGRANSLNGDGALSTEEPGNELCDIFVCNPFWEVPSLGGKGGGPASIAPMGPADQRPVEARPDVLVYTTEVLSGDVEVTGPVDIELYASSSADDTDFTVKLVDVYPDGRAINLCDSILRASFREGNEAPTPIEPDAVNRYAFRVGHTSNLFAAGHRIRLEVSSMNFPLYERTLNHFRTTRDGRYEDGQTATQKVFHDAARPSRLILPIIPDP